MRENARLCAIASPLLLVLAAAVSEAVASILQLVSGRRRAQISPHR